MLAKLRPRSVYDVLAAVGFFVAVSTGGAYAANTVFSTDIVDGEVKTPDIANQAVTGPKLKASAVVAGKLADNAVTSPKIIDDAVGAPEIATEAVGPVELRNIFFVDTVESVPPNGGVAEVVATCSPGSQLISGGAWFDFPSGDVSSSFPGGGTSWVVEGQNNGQFAQNLRARAWCMPPPAP
jgi:hypothetical protein